MPIDESLHTSELDDDRDSDSDLGDDDRDSDSDLEEEQTDPSLPIEHPFNPEAVRINPNNSQSVDNLISRIKHGEIDLAPEFQRLRGTWNSKDRSRLIESLLLRIPLPVFYVSADRRDHWTVVDGIQRLSTIYEYVEDYYDNDKKKPTPEFLLEELEYLHKLKGKKFNQLDRSMQRRIKETNLTVHIIQPGTPEEVMFNIFSRINTGGTPLNGQEIRHALHKGPVRGYLKKLTETEEFRTATEWNPKKKKGAINHIRMADRECVLRFLSFYNNPWREYPNVKDAAGGRETANLNGYLSHTMKQINGMTEGERDRIEVDFRNAMRAAKEIFGEQVFRKPPKGTRRSQISKALFETWSVHLARCSDKEIKTLIRKKATLKKRFKNEVENDPEFLRAISASTGDRTRVRKRFETIEILIREVVQ